MADCGMSIADAEIPSEIRIPQSAIRNRQA